MERREPVRIVLEKGEFVISMLAGQKAARRLSNRLARLDATWEPHDWSEFD